MQMDDDDVVVDVMNDALRHDDVDVDDDVMVVLVVKHDFD